MGKRSSDEKLEKIQRKVRKLQEVLSNLEKRPSRDNTIAENLPEGIVGNDKENETPSEGEGNYLRAHRCSQKFE